MYKVKVRYGYTTMTMIFDRALRDMPRAQCGVNFTDDGHTVFISYTTPVIYIDREGWLICTGTYSPTTRKQIGRFLREYAPTMTYQMVKQAHADNMRINIHTGEVEPLL